jgi:hypothetical protein
VTQGQWVFVALCFGVMAVVVAIGGAAFAVRSARRQEREKVGNELSDLEQELKIQQEARVTDRRYIYALRMRLAEHGIDTPPEEGE